MGDHHTESGTALYTPYRVRHTDSDRDDRGGRLIIGVHTRTDRTVDADCFTNAERESSTTAATKAQADSNNAGAVVVQEPSSGTGPGFAIPSALVALVASGLLLRRDG